jgi:hypothetical protein
MRTGYESVNAMAPVKLQNYNPPPPLDQYSGTEPGINLYAHIATRVLSALVSRGDSDIFTEDEIVDKVCKITEALLRKLP